LECPKQRLLDNLDCAATPPYLLLDNTAPVLLHTDDTHRCAYFDCYPLYTYLTERRPQTAPTRERLPTAGTETFASVRTDASASRLRTYRLRRLIRQTLSSTGHRRPVAHDFSTGVPGFPIPGGGQQCGLEEIDRPQCRRHFHGAQFRYGHGDRCRWRRRGRWPTCLLWRRRPGERRWRRQEIQRGGERDTCSRSSPRRMAQDTNGHAQWRRQRGIWRERRQCFERSKWAVTSRAGCQC